MDLDSSRCRGIFFTHGDVRMVSFLVTALIATGFVGEHPRMVADTTIHMAYQSGQFVFYGSGPPWSSMAIPDGHCYQTLPPAIEVDGNNIWIAWTRGDLKGIGYSTSTDRGQTWNTRTVHSSPIQAVKIGL